MIPLAEEVTAG